MKWEEDLTKNIRTGTQFDDRDEISEPITYNGNEGEFTQKNRELLLEYFNYVKNHCTAILEIGVCRNGDNSSTRILLQNKKPDTIYVGIDLDDKSFLNDTEKNIYTIRGNSGNILENMKQMNKWGVETFEFIFIDGWHSINQVLADWEYTRWLSDNGLVALHDVSGHPGPYYFIKALNKEKWNVEENLSPEDYGLGFAWLK